MTWRNDAEKGWPEPPENRVPPATIDGIGFETAAERFWAIAMGEKVYDHPGNAPYQDPVVYTINLTCKHRTRG